MHIPKNFSSGGGKISSNFLGRGEGKDPENGPKITLNKVQILAGATANLDPSSPLLDVQATEPYL
jgi:hypothetical protein